MNKPIRQVWTFRSDSNPDVEYQTLQYGDGSTSCNCKGWTRRVAGDGSRSCKHTRWVDLGTAGQHSTATHQYENHQSNIHHHVQPKIQTAARLGHRKFAV
jgi:hypothetical protein